MREWPSRTAPDTHKRYHTRSHEPRGQFHCPPLRLAARGFQWILLRARAILLDFAFMQCAFASALKLREGEFGSDEVAASSQLRLFGAWKTGRFALVARVP